MDLKTLVHFEEPVQEELLEIVERRLDHHFRDLLLEAEVVVVLPDMAPETLGFLAGFDFLLS